MRERERVRVMVKESGAEEKMCSEVVSLAVNVQGGLQFVSEYRLQLLKTKVKLLHFIAQLLQK